MSLYLLYWILGVPVDEREGFFLPTWGKMLRGCKTAGFQLGNLELVLGLCEPLELILLLTQSAVYNVYVLIRKAN